MLKNVNIFGNLKHLKSSENLEFSTISKLRTIFNTRKIETSEYLKIF
jgi:hypothetical protein